MFVLASYNKKSILVESDIDFYKYTAGSTFTQFNYKGVPLGIIGSFFPLGGSGFPDKYNTKLTDFVRNNCDVSVGYFRGDALITRVVGGKLVPTEEELAREIYSHFV